VPEGRGPRPPFSSGMPVWNDGGEGRDRCSRRDKASRGVLAPAPGVAPNLAKHDPHDDCHRPRWCVAAACLCVALTVAAVVVVAPPPVESDFVSQRALDDPLRRGHVWAWAAEEMPPGTDYVPIREWGDDGVGTPAKSSSMAAAAMVTPYEAAADFATLIMEAAVPAVFVNSPAAAWNARSWTPGTLCERLVNVTVRDV